MVDEGPIFLLARRAQEFIHLPLIGHAKKLATESDAEFEIWKDAEGAYVRRTTMFVIRSDTCIIQCLEDMCTFYSPVVAKAYGIGSSRT